MGGASLPQEVEPVFREIWAPDKGQELLRLVGWRVWWFVDYAGIGAIAVA